MPNFELNHFLFIYKIVHGSISILIVHRFHLMIKKISQTKLTVLCCERFDFFLLTKENHVILLLLLDAQIIIIIWNFNIYCVHFILAHTLLQFNNFFCFVQVIWYDDDYNRSFFFFLSPLIVRSGWYAKRNIFLIIRVVNQFVENRLFIYSIFIICKHS